MTESRALSTLGKTHPEDAAQAQEAGLAQSPSRKPLAGGRWFEGAFARLAIRGPVASAFTTQPEPRTIGSFARGKQLVAGKFLFGGHLVEPAGADVWQLASPDTEYERDRQGFTWMDDLAAVGDGPARALAQSWTYDWIDHFGRGVGPGWTPELTGRRITRWINHGVLLLTAQPKNRQSAFYAALSAQTHYLGRRWARTAPGLPRFEALSGLIQSSLALEGMEKYVGPAMKALAQECAQQIDVQGGVTSRSPQDLLEVFTLLTWTASALSEAGRLVPADHSAALERIAPTLRALRHADGGLARFHGGGRGLEGRLDHALAASGIRLPATRDLAMGYARLSTGRTSVIVDAARPPQGLSSINAHASTLAFELTSGRRPVIVNCGSGAVFGHDWHRAGRATPSHSTLGLDGASSSRLAARSLVAGRSAELLADTPATVTATPKSDVDFVSLSLRHDGFAPSHGVLHARQLMLSSNGRTLEGWDALVADDATQKRRFDRALADSGRQGIGFKIRFHLHPEVDPSLDLGGRAVSLALRSGEIWIFRADQGAAISLEASVYLEKGRLKPRATKQIVLSGVAMEYASRVGWTLSKAQDTPQAIRDLERDEMDLTD